MKKIIFAAMFLSAISLSSVANAGFESFSLSFGNYYPDPAPVVYYQPRPVYPQPVVVYRQAPVYYPYYYGYRPYCRHDDWRYRRHEFHEHERFERW
ncbi:MAG: hypothetical protein WCL30_06810 [Pseudomonadota bacterium]